MDLLDFIFLLLFGAWFWLGVALGLLGAWLAWTYLPPSADRATVAGLIFLMGCILGGVLATVGEKKT